MRIHRAFIRPVLSLAALLSVAASSAVADGQADTPENRMRLVSHARVESYRSNSGHTGVSSETLTAPLSLLWRHTTSYAKDNPASAVYANGTAYFVSNDVVCAVNSADGTTKWKYPSDGQVKNYFATTPTLAGGFLYVPDDNGDVFKLDATTGQEIWTKKLDGAIRSSPVISNGLVYLGSANSHCYALSADNGQVVWDAPTEGSISTAPIVIGNLVAFASADNNVYSFNTHNGSKAWVHPFDSDPSIVPMAYDGSVLFVTAGDTIFRLDPSNGNAAPRSSLQLPATSLIAPIVARDSVYAITQQYLLYSYSLTGRERWHVTLDSAATAPPLLAGSTLVVATQNGVLSCYDIRNGSLVWRYVMQASATAGQPKYPATHVYAAPILADGTLYVVSDDGSLSAFRSDAVDDIGPQFTQLVPQAGATVPSSNLIYGSLLVDDGSGIDPATVSLQLDGSTDTKALYHAGQNAIYNSLATPLSAGSHTLTVKAADWRGNATVQTWSFTVKDQPQGNGTNGNRIYNPLGPNYPGLGGRNPNAPPPPPPITPF